MNTFVRLWKGVVTPEDAAARLRAEIEAEHIGEPENLEEQALSLVGRTVYEKLIKGYTEKQWGRDCTELPAFIIKRLPVRLTFDNNYFDDRYQGIPVGGYTAREVPWTRIIEHKWFTFGKDEAGREVEKTVISREYSAQWRPGSEPFYPVNDERNSALCERYRALAEKEKNVSFGGRLGLYRYFDMDDVISAALNLLAAL